MIEKQKKQGQMELEFLKQLDPKEKEALLERLEKERKKKKKNQKKKRTKAKEALKREIQKATAPKLEIKEEIKEEPEEDTDDDEIIPEIVDIGLPKRKDEIEREQRLAAKKEFARKLAEFHAAMHQSDSDSSDSSDSDSSDSDSSESDSDYETKPSSSSGASSPGEKQIHVNKIPENVKIAPPPKAGMVLVRRKRSQIDIEEEKAKKAKMEKLKMLEMTKLLRKKMEEKQKAELAEQQKKLKAEGSTPSGSKSSEIVSDQDLTSGLLDCLNSERKGGWKPNPLIAYESSDED